MTGHMVMGVTRGRGGRYGRLMHVRVDSTRRFTAALAAAGLLLAGCTSNSGTSSEETSAPAVGGTASAPAPEATDKGLKSYYEQTLAWGRCKDRDGAQCADLKVPLDYDHPDREFITLKVLKIPAAKKDQRLGSLVLNPGGPGGSGVEYASFSPVREKVSNVFDIVGFDPRGVGASSPISCLTAEQTDELVAADGTPDDQAEIDEIERLASLVATGCKEKSAHLAPFMDTFSAARDMDILRQALGDAKLTYLGKSYGTYLGAAYADQFPGRVGRMVLDGVLPAGLSGEEIAKGQAIGFEDALRRFIDDCATQDDCPLPKNPDAAYARVQKFLADLEKKPIDGIRDRKLNEALATYAILALLYFPPQSWSQLRFGLEAAFDGDGSVLLSEVDNFLNRQPDGTYGDNAQDAFYAVSCLDRPSTGGVDRAAQLAKSWAKDAPIFGPYLAWGNITCDSWPWKTQPPRTITADGAAPIMVVSTKHDPATPFQWGVDVAGQLKKSALVTFAGDGHTGYMSGVGSACVDKVVDAYLIKGTVPSATVKCPVEG